MKRREFITLLGGATAAWPLAARAQQPAMPVIGLLHPASPDTLVNRLRGLRQGLKETGFVEGENVAIEQRWAENQIERLPKLAAEVVRRQVSVISAFGPDCSRPRRQPRQFPSSSAFPTTRSGWASSLTSPDRRAT